jgi:hypothetical protein
MVALTATILNDEVPRLEMMPAPGANVVEIVTRASKLIRKTILTEHPLPRSTSKPPLRRAHGRIETRALDVSGSGAQGGTPSSSSKSSTSNSR